MVELPTVDLAFIEGLLKSCPKIMGVANNGTTTAYVVKGNSPIAKRMCFVRCIDTDKNQVTFDCAIAIGYKIKAIDEIKAWLKEHRGFDHG